MSGEPGKPGRPVNSDFFSFAFKGIVTL
jgi:hypothetical protein